MINWDELKHIHVVRKLEQILAQWFSVEVFFLDEGGRVRNHDANVKKNFKNPFAQALWSHDRGREYLQMAMTQANEKAARTKDAHIELDGPLGVEKAVAVPLKVDGEYLGCVYAYSYRTGNGGSELSKSVLDSIGVDSSVMASAASQFKSMNEGEQRYFFELVELVGQEIVTYHTEISRREERIQALNSQLGERHRYDSMIGKSKPMQELYSVLDKITSSDATVLVQGENGTGKELIAKAIHFHSPRKGMPFVTVNCSAFNENLLDSELFGHVKGSFTGAVKDKKGLFEAANRGTLFLDEIGDMSLSMQVKLLRVLQEGTLMPVGGTEQRKVDVRIIAATNKDLKAMVEAGTFREDLYYRINVINIVVPPLRDRKEDIPVLLDHFVMKGCKDKGVSPKQFAKRAMEKIYDYPWPGNIRELENEVERLIVLSGEDSKISAELLSARIRDHGGDRPGLRVSGRLKDALEELEKMMIKEGLRRTKWNKSRLAKELGISRAGLIMKVEKYGLDKRSLARAAEAAGQTKDSSDEEVA